MSQHPASYRGYLRDRICELIRTEVTEAINKAPKVVYFDKDGRSHEVAEDNDTIIREFIRIKLSAKQFLDGPWATSTMRSPAFHRNFMSNSQLHPEWSDSGKFTQFSTPPCFRDQDL